MPTEVLGCQQFRKEWRKRQRRIIIRGGVEDTRLEAKDTKKSEAKDSLSEDRHSRGQDQGHKRKCSPKKKKVFTKIFQAISTKKRFPKNFSSSPQNFNNSKNSAVLEPRTGQFSRTWGLEAKDLTFEAKAKDFKMCPRGQGRPRGLHLWSWPYLFVLEHARDLAETLWKPFSWEHLNFRENMRCFCVKTFFFWKTLALCDLGPWPRAFLSLALRGSVLGKSVFGLGTTVC